jgi:methionyl aminopeptidase
MSISKESELVGMKKISDAVSTTLLEMQNFTKAGMSAYEIDQYGGKILEKLGAKSAPYLTYSFPGFTCISVNHEVAHGIPSKSKIIQEGDLINIDVSAELDGFWSDNGSSFVLGKDYYGHQKLVDASKSCLKKALDNLKGGVKVSEIGRIIYQEAKSNGFRVIKNLAGHGVGRSLHEKPENILNYRNRFNQERFKSNQVVAIETFISTASDQAEVMEDGWTLVGNKGGYVAQHEHTVIITNDKPVILTSKNKI